MLCASTGNINNIVHVFINNLSDNIKSSVRLFADDCVLYMSIHSLQSKKDSKDQESIQSSTTPVPGYQMGK